MDYRVLLKTMVQQKASDLQLMTGESPVLKANDKVMTVKSDPLSQEYISGVIEQVLTDEQLSTYRSTGEVLGGFGIKGIGGFRIKVLTHKGNPAIIFRHVPEQ